MDLDEYRRMAEVESTHWWYEASRRLLRDLLEPRLVRGGTFLDAGGGTGATAAWMAEHGSLVAADFEPAALELNRELHPGTAGFAAGDLRHLPFADGSFDASVCVTVLYHSAVPRPLDAVRELARVTKPGGYVVLWEPGVRRLRRAHDRVTHTGRRFSLADLRMLATEAGLVVERATGAHSYLVVPAALKMLLERGDTSSDLDKHQGGLGGALTWVAASERRLLRRISLPFGLSVVVVARRPE